MPRFCASCGGQMDDNATFCPSCGKPMTQPVGATGVTPATAVTPAQTTASGGLQDNVAGMLAYITIIPAIIFLVLEPYNKKPFVRFHSFQHIFFFVAWVALWIVMSIIGMIPVLGWLTLIAWPILGLGGFVIWLVLLLKAYQGKMFKLPVIGDMAEKQANAI